MSLRQSATKLYALANAYYFGDVQRSICCMTLLSRQRCGR